MGAGAGAGVEAGVDARMRVRKRDEVGNMILLKQHVVV